MPKFSAADVKKFSEELQESGFSKTGFFSKDPAANRNDAQNDVVAGMQHRLSRYSSELDRGGISDERLTHIAQEVFVISCASTKSVAASISFAEKCGLNNDPNFLNNFSKDDPTLNPLNAAVVGGDAKKVSDLVEVGANPNVPSEKSGNTTAHFAAALGVSEKMMQTLVDVGADLNRENNGNMTALDCAKIGGHTALAGFIEEQGGKKGSFQSKFAKTLSSQDGEEETKEQKLGKAIDEGKVQEAQYFIGKGANVNASENGQSLTQRAVNSGNISVVEAVASRADIRTKENLNAGSEVLVEVARGVGPQQSQVHSGIEEAPNKTVFSWVEMLEERKKRQELGRDGSQGNVLGG